MGGFHKIVNGLASLIFFVMGVGVLAYTIWCLESLSEWKATLLCAYSLAMFFLVFRRSLSGLSVFGLKAKLKKKIHEADEITKGLRSLTTLFMKPTIMTVASLGRIGSGFSLREKWEIKSRAMELMKSIGISQNEIDDTLLELHRYNLCDLLEEAKQPLIDLLKEKHERLRSDFDAKFRGKVIQAHEHEEHRDALERLRCHESFYCKYRKKELRGYDLIFESYNELIKTIKECSVLTDEERTELLKDTQELNDLKYYCENRDFADPARLD